MSSSFKYTNKYTLQKPINKEMYEQAEAQGLQIYDTAGRRAVGVDSATGKVEYEYENQPSNSSATITGTGTTGGKVGSDVGKITHDNPTGAGANTQTKSTNNSGQLVDTSAYNHLLPNQNPKPQNTTPEREGSRIRNRVTSVITDTWKDTNASHLFDDIDDDTIEKNIPLAKELVEKNKKTGYLGSDPDNTYPYMLDGMTMYLASGDKNNPKAAKKSHDVAYWEDKSKNAEASSWENISATKEQTNNKPNNTVTKETNLITPYKKTDDLLLSNTDYYTKTQTAHAPLRKSGPKNSLLSEQDLEMPWEAQTKLLECKEQYAKAEEELNYIEMNRIHKEASELRQQHYDYVDDYDYTHGGLYDIYINGDDTYIEGGHYEHVFKIGADSLLNLCINADKNFGNKHSNLDYIEDVGVAILSKVISKYAPATIAKFLGPTSIGYAIAKGAYNTMITEPEEKAFETAISYGDKIDEEYEDKEVDYYMYLLDGGYSTELKIKVVDKATGEILDENNFDLRQYKSYNAFFNSAEEKGNLVAINRRHWMYSYIER